MQTNEALLRRADPRSEVMDTNVRGILSREGGQPQSPFVVWDISDQGLRVWVPSHLRRGEAIKATIAKPFVILLTAEVRWCKEAAGQGGYYIGLQVLSNYTRLEALHTQLIGQLRGGERPRLAI